MTIDLAKTEHTLRLIDQTLALRDRANVYPGDAKIHDALNRLLDNLAADLNQAGPPMPQENELGHAPTFALGFKVGDRVRIARRAGADWPKALDETVGEEGTVTSVNVYGGDRIRVEGMPSDREGGGWLYDPASLELVTQQPAEVLPRVVDWADLRPGDLG